MRFIETKAFYYLLALQILLIILAIFDYQNVLTGASILGLALKGIPHGANDVLHRHHTPFGKMGVFLSVYIGLILVYGVLWLIFPLVSLLLFLAVSVHHFGQTVFESRHKHHLSSYLWGGLFILLPVAIHSNEAFSLFSEMGNRELVSPDRNLMIGLSVFLAIIMMLVIWKNDSRRMWIRVLVQVVTLCIWFYYAPLLEGFLLAFILWHAVPSSKQQFDFFIANNPKGKSQFWRTMIVYTFFAFLGLLGFAYFEVLDPAFLFILLSLITLPHALVIHQTMPKQENAEI